MIAREGIFALFGTPAAVGTLTGGSDAKTARWDTARNNDLSELLAWYSLEHWYAWQVTVQAWVGTDGNADAKRLVGQLLAQGGLFAFGLSEREHGADIYSTDMVLTPNGGGWRASGEKYYIGNGNCAARVSVFGRVQRPGDRRTIPPTITCSSSPTQSTPDTRSCRMSCTARCMSRNSGSRITR